MKGLKGIIILAMLAGVPLAQAGELRDMRLWDGPEATRVVFDLSEAGSHNIFTLDNPSRVVIDLAGVGNAAGSRVVARQQPLGVVQKLRTGPRPDGLRVVFELSTPVSPKSFTLEPNGEYGYRLMVDLPKAVTATVPAASDAPVQAVTDPAPALVAEAEAVMALPAVATAAAAGPAPAAVAAPAIATTPAAVPTNTPAVAQLQPVKHMAPASASFRLQEKPIVVAIDAGHGGDDPGAIGKTGLQEKNVALAIARKLAARVNATPGMKAVLTRDGDYYLGLRERIAAARKANADLFVSVHANAFKRDDMRGTAVYVLSPRGQTNEHARWLAHKENSADFVGGMDLQTKDNDLAAVLIDLSQNATMEASFDVGTRILKSMGGVNTLQKPVVQQAGFVVLKAPDIPSVLVETAFITNPHEERLLADSEHQDKMADSIFDGVRGYFSSYRPQQQIAESDAAMQKMAEAVQVSLKKQRPLSRKTAKRSSN